MRIADSASAWPPIAPTRPNSLRPISTIGMVSSSRQQKMRNNHRVRPTARSTPSSGSAANGVMAMATRKMGTLAS